MEKTGFTQDSIKENLEFSLFFSKFKPTNITFNEKQVVDMFMAATSQALIDLSTIQEKLKSFEISTDFIFTILTFDQALKNHRVDQEEFKALTN